MDNVTKVALLVWMEIMTYFLVNFSDFTRGVCKPHEIITRGYRNSYNEIPSSRSNYGVLPNLSA